MYKIIGSDQKVYGPVTADQVKQWLGEGRVNSATLVQADETGIWKPLSSFPELAPPPAPALVVAAPPRQTATPALVTSDENGAATAGFVFGLLSILPCCCFSFIFAVIGLVFSCMALSRANRLPREEGKSLAIAGLILSIIGLGSGLVLPSLISLLSHGPNFHYNWSHSW